MLDITNMDELDTLETELQYLGHYLEDLKNYHGVFVTELFWSTTKPVGWIVQANGLQMHLPTSL